MGVVKVDMSAECVLEKDADDRWKRRWYRKVMRRFWGGYIGKRMPSKEERGRSKRRFIDVVREKMREVGVMEELADERWKWLRCGDRYGE